MERGKSRIIDKEECGDFAVIFLDVPGDCVQTNSGWDGILLTQASVQASPIVLTASSIGMGLP